MFASALVGLCALAGVSMIFDGKKGGWPVFGLFGIVAILCVVQLWPYHLWSRKSGPANELGMFPGPVTLRCNRVKSFIIALASSGLAGVFGWSLFNGSASLVAAVIYCSLSVGFSLSASVLLAATLNPNRLVLGPDSIDLHALLRRAKWRWQDIGGFKVGCTLHTSNPGFVYRRSSMVSFDDVSAPDTRLTRRLNRLTGRNAGFQNTFELSDEELVRLLTSWQKRSSDLNERAVDV